MDAISQLSHHIEIIEALHAKWQPHEGQIPIGRALLMEGLKDLFVQAGRNFGKCLDLSTPVLTPSGFRPISEIQAGDWVYSEHGKPIRVLASFDPIENLRCLEFTFKNGQKVICDDSHLWVTHTKANRKSISRDGLAELQIPRIRHAWEIEQSLMSGLEYNHKIPTIPSLEGGTSMPWSYLLGCWLGDGHTHQAAITSMDPEILQAFRDEGFQVNARSGTEISFGLTNGFLAWLRSLKVYKNKHIPKEYLHSDRKTRQALLAGLMDTDGTVNKAGQWCSFSNKNESLIDDVCFLAASLGAIPSKRRKIVQGETYWEVDFPSVFNPFRLSRKRQRVDAKVNQYSKRHWHTITDVREVPTRPVKCIKVENPSGLFLITPSLIPTHNTELMCYLLWRWAATYPGSENYYFSPFMKQSREILWASQRLQGFGPRDWLLDGSRGINSTEMRLVFHNGSFIKLDGSDNVEAYRGVKPKGLSIFDEFKDFRPDFYTAFDPNRAAHGSPLVIIGTPPDRDGQFTDVAKDFRDNPAKRYFEAPSWTNPHLDRTWLANKKKELYARGEGEIWEREYGAKFVKGGASKVFPMLSNTIIEKHQTILQKLSRDRKKITWINFSDPAAATCFGSLFLAYNPYTKHLYCLDEIYEKDQGKMTVRQIGKQILSTCEELEPKHEWRLGYDEAETWFANEMLDNFGEHVEPSRKHLHDIESGITLIKDILLAGKITLSDRCRWLFWELDNYFKDKNGRYPKDNKHLMDCLRYILGALSYELKPETEYVESQDEDFRGARFEDDFPHIREDGFADSWEV